MLRGRDRLAVLDVLRLKYLHPHASERAPRIFVSNLLYKDGREVCEKLTLVRASPIPVPSWLRETVCQRNQTMSQAGVQLEHAYCYTVEPLANLKPVFRWDADACGNPT